MERFVERFVEQRTPLPAWQLRLAAHRHGGVTKAEAAREAWKGAAIHGLHAGQPLYAIGEFRSSIVRWQSDARTQ